MSANLRLSDSGQNLTEVTPSDQITVKLCSAPFRSVRPQLDTVLTLLIGLCVRYGIKHHIMDGVDHDLLKIGLQCISLLLLKLVCVHLGCLIEPILRLSDTL